MNVLWNILGQPLVLCWFVFRHLKVASVYVLGGLFSGHSVTVAAGSRFLGWLFFALVILTVIFFALRYILEDALCWPIARAEIRPVLGSVIGRLVAALVVYAALSLILYGAVNLSALISKNTALPQRHFIPGSY